MADDRAAREEKVIDAIREWLPELTTPAASVTITVLDPEHSESRGAMFRVTRTRAFVCRRGGRA